MKNITFVLLAVCFLLMTNTSGYGQFVPVAVSGFNQDIVAETGNNSLATTTVALDGVPVSNHVMYTTAFRNTNSFGGGGIPDNGLITSGSDSYQMEAFNTNNALIVPRNQNADLNIVSPSSFRKIRVLCLSTEGASLVNVRLFFTDGTVTNAVSNATINDWFTNTGNIVTRGFGRCKRANPATNASGYPNSPVMFYLEITLNCNDSKKSLEKINFSNVTTAGSNAPFPNAVFFALSGISYNQTISSNIIDADCNAGGAISLTIAGSGAPYSVSWNATPTQTGLNATNLPSGNYIATITDANSCISTYNATVNFNNNLYLTTHRDTTICSGTSFTPNTQSNATLYSWSPSTGVSSPGIANPILSPLATTTYFLNATLGACNDIKSFTVIVNPAVVVDAGPSVIIFSNSSTHLNATGSAGNYLWTPANSLSATNILNPIATPLSTTQYTLTITSAQGCQNSDSVLVTVIPECAHPSNAFSPNGDGINDLWIVTEDRCTNKVSAVVYNRYGTKVYESKEYHNNWNGTYKGKPLPDGTYYYVLSFEQVTGANIVVKGDVTIIR